MTMGGEVIYCSMENFSMIVPLKRATAPLVIVLYIRLYCCLRALGVCTEVGTWGDFCTLDLAANLDFPQQIEV